jgi:hypothetical protein
MLSVSVRDAAPLLRSDCRQYRDLTLRAYGLGGSTRTRFLLQAKSVQLDALILLRDIGQFYIANAVIQNLFLRCEKKLLMLHWIQCDTEIFDFHFEDDFQPCNTWSTWSAVFEGKLRSLPTHTSRRQTSLFLELSHSGVQ